MREIEHLLSTEMDEAGRIESEKNVRIYGHPKKHTLKNCLVFLLLMTSLTLNAAMIVRYNVLASALRKCKSPVAGLVPDVTHAFGVVNEYGMSHDLNLTDHVWDSLQSHTGMVAISKSPNFHPTETFPWDPEKGVYMLNGYHGLHCLKLIYVSIREFQLNSPQSQPFEHVIHCLGALREDVLCSADDTPRFAGNPVAGDTFQQERTCRDWHKLESWAKKNSACFKRVDRKDPRYETLYEWTSCPEGSGYREKAKAWLEREHSA